MVYAIDWTTVIVSLITAIPATVGAFAALVVRRNIRTPSGGRIGEVVENAHQTGIANNLLLRAMNGEGLDPQAPGMPSGAHGTKPTTGEER